MKKRILKNIIMLVLIVGASLSMVFTMYYAKNHVTKTTSPSNSEMKSTGNNSTGESNSSSETGQSNTQNNSNDSSSVDSNSNSADNSSNTPPEKPDNSSDNTDNNSSTPPEKPSENSDNQNNSNEQSSDNSIPEKPSDNSTQSSRDNQDNSNGMLGTSPDDMKASITWIYYLIFGAEGLIASLLIMYLIMSRFNKKSFKETFTNGDKVIILILSVIILTSAFTYLDSKITNDYFITNDSTTSNQSNTTYSASTKIESNETITSGDYSSTSSDENAILVTSNSNLSNISVTKTGDSDGGDNTSFYGNNSAILAKDGANLTLKNINVSTSATGANGVFSYGGSATTNNSSSDGTTINISDSTITTTKDNSGGIMTTGGGIMNATNLKVKTAGTSSAAIRTDRGGGTVTVNKGTYKTTGQGSPSIYSTADVSVSNAKLISKVSEGVVIEGKNSVTLDNVTLTDTNSKLNGKSTTYKNIFLYQSMSGDADSGVATFTSKNSKITTNKGDTLYVTNTKATITLENNTIKNNDSSGNFLRIQKDSWGNSGSNGGDVTLIMKNQKVTGNIVVDSISTLDMSLKSKSYYEGTINGDNSAKSISLKLSKNSKIKLTGDSYVTSLDNADSSNSNIDFNGYKLYVNGNAIN